MLPCMSIRRRLFPVLCVVTALVVTPGRAEDPNLARFGAATASSVWSATYAAGKGNDNAAASLWAAGASDTAAWWQVDLGASFAITRVQLLARQDSIDEPAARVNFEVRGSNSSDGSDATVLAAHGSVAFAQKGTWTADVSAPGAFRYLRVAKTDTGSFSLAEFRAWSGVAVTNGSFETGNLAGWIVASSDTFPPACVVASGIGAAHGTYALELGTDNRKGNAILTQTNTTDVGAGHTLRFAYGAFANRYLTQQLRVEVLGGGSVLASGTYTRTSSAPYPALTVFGSYELAFTATTPSTVIRFCDQTALAASSSCDGVLDAVELLRVNAAAAAPTLSPAPGLHVAPQTVTLASSTPGAIIRFTLDGSEPTATHGQLYSGPLPVTTTREVRAVAMLNGLSLSPVTSGTYTIPLSGSVILIN